MEGAGGTRWVGHILRALEHFLDEYPAFRLHLEQLAASKEKSDGKAKVIGFLKLLRSQDIIAMALFLQDILTVLHKVSLKFQKHGSIVAEVSLCINTAIQCLKLQYLRLSWCHLIQHGNKSTEDLGMNSHMC